MCGALLTRAYYVPQQQVRIDTFVECLPLLGTAFDQAHAHAATLLNKNIYEFFSACMSGRHIDLESVHIQLCSCSAGAYLEVASSDPDGDCLGAVLDAFSAPRLYLYIEAAYHGGLNPLLFMLCSEPEAFQLVTNTKLGHLQDA